MEKVIIKRKRPKAFIGAIIGAVGSIASGIMQNKQANDLAKSERNLAAADNKRKELEALSQTHANDVTSDVDFKNRFRSQYRKGGNIPAKSNRQKCVLGGSTSSQFSPKLQNPISNTVVQNRSNVAKKRLESADIDLESDRTEYAKGGKRKCAKGGVEPVITAGGNGVAVSDSLTLLRGKKHKDGGIIIGKGQNSIEAESGEVIKREKNQMKIFSAEPILNGKSPARKVLENPNKANKVFQEQESYKDRNNLNNDGTKKYIFGGLEDSDLTAKKLAAKKLLDKRLNTGANIINAAAPLVSGLISSRAIDKTKAPSTPINYKAAKLKTDYNINPQLSELERNKQRAIRDTDANTISSVASLSRKQRIGTDTTLQKNLLFGQKENVETGLRNQDALNQQQISMQNVAQSNDYNNRKNQFETEKLLAKADINNQMIGESTSAIRDWQSRKDKQKQERNAMAAIMAKNPEQADLFIKNKKKYEDYLDGDTFKCGGKKKLSRKK